MIEIFGTDENKLFEACIEFFAKALSVKVPMITLLICDDMQAQGECYQSTPQEYMITLKQTKIGHMLETLAHEMVHVKQFLLDDLGNKFDSEIPYAERWWEKEAYAKQTELAHLLLAEIKAGKISA